MIAEACRELVVQTAAVSLAYSPDSSSDLFTTVIQCLTGSKPTKSCNSFVLIIRACAKYLCGQREDDSVFD